LGFAGLRNDIANLQKEHLLPKQFFWETSMLSIDHYPSDWLELKQLLQEIMEIIRLEHEKRVYGYGKVRSMGRGSLTAFEKENYQNYFKNRLRIIGTSWKLREKLSERSKQPLENYRNCLERAEKIIRTPHACYRLKNIV